jgi:hypothetical protein
MQQDMIAFHRLLGQLSGVEYVSAKRPMGGFAEHEHKRSEYAREHPKHALTTYWNSFFGKLNRLASLCPNGRHVVDGMRAERERLLTLSLPDFVSFSRDPSLVHDSIEGSLIMQDATGDIIDAFQRSLRTA